MLPFWNDTIHGIVTDIMAFLSLVLSIHSEIKVHSFKKQFASKVNNMNFHEYKADMISELERIKEQISIGNIGLQTFNALVVVLSSATYFAQNVPFSKKDISEISSFSDFIREIYQDSNKAKDFDSGKALYRIQQIILILKKGDNQ